MYYIYRFKNDDGKVIYVGKTQNLIKRMLKHYNSGHLPKDCYDQVVTIEYLIARTKVDMDIQELYYINRDCPKYNQQLKHESGVTIKLNEDENWKTLKITDFLHHNKFNHVMTLLEYALLNDQIILDESVDADSFLMGANFVKQRILTNLKNYIEYFSRQEEVFHNFTKDDILVKETKNTNEK